MVLKVITFSSNKSFVSSQDAKMFSLEMKNATPMNLILTSPDMAYGLYNVNTDVNIYVSNVSAFYNFFPIFFRLYLAPVRCRLFSIQSNCHSRVALWTCWETVNHVGSPQIFPSDWSAWGSLFLCFYYPHHEMGNRNYKWPATRGADGSSCRINVPIKWEILTFTHCLQILSVN